MKLLSTVFIFFCIAVFQARAVGYERGLPKIPGDVMPGLGNHYSNRFYQRRDPRQGRELGDKLSQKLKDVLRAINEFIDDMQAKAADSIRRYELQAMLEKVKNDLKDLGKQANLGSEGRAMAEGDPCEVHKHPHCNK